MGELFNNLSVESGGILLAVVIYVTRSLVEFASKIILKNKDKIEENTQAVKDLNVNISHLSVRLVNVENSIEKLSEVKSIVWKLDRDVSYAHEKIRDLKDETRRE